MRAQLVAQGLFRRRHAALDRPERDAQHLRRVRIRHALVAAQHEDQAQLLAQLRDGRADGGFGLAGLRGGRRARAGAGVPELRGRLDAATDQRGLLMERAQLRLGALVEPEVLRDLEQPRGDLAHRAVGPARTPHPQEGLLQVVLGGDGVVAHAVEEVHQRTGVAGIELLEGRGVVPADALHELTIEPVFARFVTTHRTALWARSSAPGRGPGQAQMGGHSRGAGRMGGGPGRGLVRFARLSAGRSASSAAGPAG